MLGEHDETQMTSDQTGLSPRLAGRIYGVTGVARPKPAPDVFLYVASQLGVQPSQCVVVEDSPSGVRAAVSAGMTVLGYSALMPSDRLIGVGAHLVFSDMCELPELLARFNTEPA
jgi:beta-phosphoglucomutase-like phosphatase (HAD superfamily)